MRQLARVSIVLILMLAFGGYSLAVAKLSPSSSANPAQGRLVVFETFMRPG